ncbi:methyl-accepting chemotaxis protein [Rummeliibacillus pycnus]|uniref:methyl-accepting chemotaxis protein n=1 Tax=Rummeliibacillus pycnus TaxID=101070 RepID=UPI0037CC24B7
MSVKFKSFFSFGVIFLLILFLGIFQQINSNTQKNNAKQIKEKALQSALLADHLKLSVVEVQQYLSDISATRAQDGLDDGFEKAEEQSQIFYKNLNKLKQLDPEKSKELEAIKLSFDSYYLNGKQMAQRYIQGGPKKGNKAMANFDQTALDINNKVDQFQNEKVSEINQSLEDIENLIDKNELNFDIIGIIVFLVGIIIATLLSRAIHKPLHKLMESSERIAQGDLSHSVVLKSRDEFSKLSQSFEQMRLNLSQLIHQINQTSEQITSSSEELTASAEETGKATEQITNAMQEVADETEKQVVVSISSSDSVSEVATGMSQSATAIQAVTDLSNHAKDYAGNGNATVQKALVQMEKIRSKVDSSSDIINRLGKKSKEIGQITTLITDISNQTNLLALNASIESARAGEHGKGFAVVAEEVKKLAEQSSRSASKIYELIEQIQTESDNAIHSMNEGTAAVKDGMTMTSEAGTAFKGISTIIEKIFEQIQDVSAVIEQVNASADNMEEVMNEIHRGSEESASNAKNVAQAAEEQNVSMQEIFTSADALSNMAIELQKSVNQFKL